MNRILVLAALVSLGLPGCAARRLADVEQAEAAYERCVAERGEEDDECEVLEERKKAEQRRYEGDAKQRWGCNPAQEECPNVR